MTRAKRRPAVTVETFRSDPLFPRVERAVAEILARGKVVAPVDVLVHMELLQPEALDDWRFGRIPYLQRVIQCNLSRLGRLLRILRMHAHDLKLVPSHTAYVKWGKGPRHPLRFTKTGEPNVEAAYSRHFVWPGKGPFHPPRVTDEVKFTRHARASEVLARFPNARRHRGGEGCVCHIAERSGRFYLVVDQTTLGEFLDEEDSEMVEGLVRVFEFDRAEERAEYVCSVLGPLIPE